MKRTGFSRLPCEALVCITLVRVCLLTGDHGSFSDVDADDPPVFLTVSGDDTLPCPKICIHHPVFGVRLKAAADVAGATTFLEHEVYKEGADRRARNSATYIERPTSGDGRNVKYKSAMGFIFDHVGMDAGGKPKPVAI